MSHKPLKANELSYVLEAQFKGVGVQDVLGKVDHETRIRQLVEVAIIAGEENVTYEYDGMKFNVAVKAVTELQYLHNIDAVKEIATLIEHEIRHRSAHKFADMFQEIREETNQWRKN